MQKLVLHIDHVGMSLANGDGARERGKEAAGDGESVFHRLCTKKVGSRSEPKEGISDPSVSAAGRITGPHGRSVERKTETK